MLLQPTSTDTTSFMLLGFGAMFVILFGYLLTWWVRQRNLKKDLDLIDSLKEDKD
jgi:hypothetical protein